MHHTPHPKLLYHSGMETEQDNPFTPGIGVPPPFRAGHKRATGELDRQLRRVCQGKPGNGVVLHGPRGNGKTTLLGELFDNAQSKGALAYTLRTTTMTGGLGELRGQLMEGSPSVFEKVRSVGGSAFGFGASLAFTETRPVKLDDALNRMLAEKPVVLLVDEAHEMPADSGGAILQIAQDCILRRLPLLLVLAGTPGLEENLARMHASFWERCIRLRIERLESDDDVREALSVPAKQFGRPFDDDALDLLVPECQRYPYFVQVIGSATWDASDESGNTRCITLENAKAGLAAANLVREEFYESRRSEAERQGVLPAAEAVSRAMVAKGKDPRLRDKELKSVLEEATSSAGSPPLIARDALARLGLIWKTAGRNWEPGIPSLCAYLAEHSED